MADEKRVEIPLAVRGHVQGILTTARAHGDLSKVTFMGRYLLHVFQQHMEHHGHEYYEEGKDIRNRISVIMTAVERAQRGADGTIPTFAKAEELLKVGTRKGKSKPAAPALQPDLLAVTNEEPAMKKLRSDSLWARLDATQRKTVWDLLVAGKSYTSVRETCASWGVKTSEASLCAFFQQMQSRTTPQPADLAKSN